MNRLKPNLIVKMDFLIIAFIAPVAIYFMLIGHWESAIDMLVLLMLYGVIASKNIELQKITEKNQAQTIDYGLDSEYMKGMERSATLKELVEARDLFINQANQASLVISENYRLKKALEEAGKKS